MHRINYVANEIDTQHHIAIKINTKDVLVTDAELVLVKTNDVKWFERCVPTRFGFPVLISRTEKIEDGDSIIDEEKTQIINNVTQDIIKSIKSSRHKWFKILALPEHFSPEHLQMIVDGKLKNGDKVMIECEQVYWKGTKLSHEDVFKIKLNPYITIYPVEEKKYTREEVMSITFRYGNYVKSHKRSGLLPGKGNWEKELSFNEWFEQNVK